MSEVRELLIDWELGQKLGEFDRCADGGGCSDVGYKFGQCVQEASFGVERWVRIDDAVD